MVFSSLIFVYAFLPIQLLIYHLSPAKYKNAVLLAFSLIFYGWSGPLYLLILAGDSFVCWFFAKRIQKGYDAVVINRTAKKKFLTQSELNPKDHSKLYLSLAVIILLLVLVCFKYLTLLSDMINGALGLFSLGSIPVLKVTLPIGISFYTFQLISYVVDVYRKKVPANNSYYKVLLYAGLFHQCIAGPIVRYETIASEIDKRNADVEDVFQGIKRFSIGLAKKAVLANSVATLADTFLSTDTDILSATSTCGLIFGAVCYTLQIYLDFSAYSDMAIGLGRMIGFHYMENFNYPYIANSVKDFWRRWHISLSTFFRDYVYIPLGGNRVKALRVVINLLIVWMLTGLWHGASLNFVLWGIYYFLFLIIEKYVFKNKTLPVVGNIYTLIVVTLGWVLFRFDSFGNLTIAIKGLMGGSAGGFVDANMLSALKSNVFLLIWAILACTPLFKKLSELIHNGKNGICKVISNILDVLIPALMLILATLALVGNSYNPFLYFRF